MKSKENRIAEISIPKRLMAALMAVTYIFVLTPVTLFADSRKTVAVPELKAEVTEEKAEVLISAENGGTIVLGRAKIEIPAGALKEDTTISITRLREVSDTGESLYNATAESGGYRFLPAGTKFQKDVTITLPYSAELNSKLQSLDDLYTYFYDTEKQQWIKLERIEVDKDHCLVKSLSTHFTDMINATLTLPESASPVDVNLNSIKNLEAAKPDSHLIKFNPPKANNTGDASFSFDLAIPSGRHGMEPKVSVSFSSGGGNGIMGKGFDVSYGSSITTDTRKGLPDYDKENTYMLDGVLLKKADPDAKGDVIEYKAERESAFNRIIRFGAGTDTNYWEVTDKGGTKRIYGKDSAACVGSGKETFTWNMTKVIDVYGNTIDYKYEKDSGYVYPDSIHYTGFNDKEGSYSVKFLYDEGNIRREDVRIDARSREIVSCKRLLTSITTHYNNGPAIRTYKFDYTEGLAKEKMLSKLIVVNNADEGYEYTFDYVQPKVDNENKVIYFGSTEKWNNGQAIRTGKGDSGGGNFSVSGGVGVGELFGFSDVRITGGGQGSITNSTNETESTIVDVNGDGRPDYVKVKNGILYYRLNNGRGFSGEASCKIDDISLDSESSQNFSIGWNLYGGAGFKIPLVSGLGASYSDVYQVTTSTVSNALTDIDGDRKIDIVISGKDYYLKNTSVGDVVSFLAERYDTKNCQPVENNTTKLTADELSEYREVYKIQTPFRQWKSAYDGKIQITQNLSTNSNFSGTKVSTAVSRSDNDQIEATFVVSVAAPNQTQEQKTIIDISKNENLYFMTKTEEPQNADVNYGIKIEYTDIKAYKTRLPEPVFYPKKRYATAPERLEKIYRVEKETEPNSSGYAVDVWKLENDWQKLADDKVYEKLIENKEFLPGAFTEVQFEKIIACFKDKNNTKETFQNVAETFVHDITSGLYIVKNPNEEMYDLLIESGLSEVIKEAWDNYKIAGIEAKFSNGNILYRQSSSNYSIGSERSKQIVGTIINDGRELVLGKKDGKTISLIIPEGIVSIDNKQIPNFTGETENSDSCCIVRVNDKENNEEITYVFSDLNTIAQNITKNEMQNIVDDYQFEGDSLNDEFWKKNDLTEDEILSLIKLYGIEDSKTESFRNLVYNEIVKEIENNDAGEVTNKKVYSRKDKINEADFIEASKILADSKFIRVTRTEFPYYELSDTGEYVLNKSLIFDEQLAETEIRKNREAIEEHCVKHGLTKYEKVQVTIQYKDDSLYEIQDGCFSTYRLIDESINIKTVQEKLGQIKWDSINAWNNKLVEDEIILFKDNTQSLQLSRVEKLFPGNKNWFFGIWINGEEDFNGKNIEKILSPKSNDEFAYTETADALKNMTKEEAKKKKSEIKEQPIYLPVYNVKMETSDIYPVTKESLSHISGIEGALIGQVSMSAQKNKQADGSYMMETEFYFPFIKGNTVHAGRLGGNAYYQIDGINSLNGDNNNFTFPSVRLSRNEGNDSTFGVNLNSSYESISNSGEIEKLYTKSIGQASGTFGSNNSDGYLTQTVMDVNGDSIPDIIQKTKTGVNIIPGKKTADGIVFTEQYTVNDISINGTSSKTTIYGGAISADGSVRNQISKGGKVESVSVIPSSSGGAGATTVTGDSYVNSGFVDINGDGLPDYYDGSKVKINIGKTFLLTDAFKNFQGDLNASKLKSSSVNGSFSPASIKGESLSSGVSVGMGCSYSISSNTSSIMYMDINGDGLSDKLKQEDGTISVMYNTGSSFSEGKNIYLPEWDITEDDRNKLTIDKDVGFELGLFGKLPIIGPMSEVLVNILPVYNPYGISDINNMEFSSTISMGLSGNIGASSTFETKIVIAGTSVNATLAAGNGLSGSTSINFVDVSLMDLDGDGLADHVLRIPEQGTYWKQNISGTYGQLERVNLPQGGNIEIGYEPKYGTTDNPNFKYVMSKVTVNDGVDGKGKLPEVKHGKHSVVTSYNYDGGYYDRELKEFLGFGTVTTTTYDTVQTDEYYNREYYSKGCINTSTVKDLSKNILSVQETVLNEAPYALVKKETVKNYENGKYLTVSTEYEYDNFGNCEKLTQDFGDGKKLVADISYTEITDKYIMGLPYDIKVTGSNGVLRHRWGKYDENGQLEELHQYYNQSAYSVNTLKYDNYGNIIKVSDSRGATLEYKYDETHNMFLEEIKQYGTDTDVYKSKIEYDYALQLKKSETDCNGNSLTYNYDSWQRIEKIFTSYDKDGIPAVSYEYHTPDNSIKESAGLWYAITNNKVAFESSEKNNPVPVIQTVLQIDGLGRAVRTSKTGCVNGELGWNVSGVVEYDEKGRAIAEGMPEFVAGSLNDLLLTTPEMTELKTSYEYDVKDRQIKTILPDDSEQSALFSIEGDRAIARSTDPNGNVSIQESDSRGNIVRVAREDKNGKQLTEVTYEYNEMGEMCKAYDSQKNAITVEYDMLGRRTALESKDSGRQEFFYDECSNLVRENNSVLREQNKQINYTYDNLNRLIYIDYPGTEEDTVYVYGKTSDSNINAAGKILSVKDSSGTISYEYGQLGEVVKETRVLNTHLNGKNDTELAVMQYQSDYLGRMQWIIYPDGEKIIYGYDAGGQVTSVEGSHYNQTFPYVTKILYDQYGQRTRIEYGNGTYTDYAYNPERRWLETVKTKNKYGQSYQNIRYDFDRVGNVRSYVNDCMDTLSGNYRTEQSYGYDDLYQLIHVTGNTEYYPAISPVPDYKSTYTQDFAFDDKGLGNMMSKVSKETVSPLKVIGDNLNYNIGYVYDENYAHRLVQAGNRYYKYDANGNIICEQDGSFDGSENDVSYYKVEQHSEDVYSTDNGWGLFKDESGEARGQARKYRRTYTWNSRNQLVSSVDANYSTSYVYGQDGQRSNKYTQGSETLYFNKMWTLHTDNGNSVYGGQYAKNVYLGETRIVTKLARADQKTAHEETYKQYYYHSDHLGSASMITDWEGKEYQRIEYTPYGETWVEKTSNSGAEFLPYRFTGKEVDQETGLYYYGARYLDPKYSMWISTDPALGEYIPEMGKGNAKDSGNLPGMGGVYNHINFHLYHYAGNNPVRFVDPTGAFNWDTNTIEAGDTLTKITNKFNQIYETNYSVDEVAQACGIANKDYIREGDKLDFSKILPEWHISARGSGIGAWVGALFLFAGVQADLSGYTMNFVITETGERFSGKYYSLSKDGQALKIGCGIYTIDIEAHAVFKGVKPTPQQVKKSFEGSSKNIGVSVIFAGISGSENDLWLVNSGTLSYSTGLPFSVGFENSETWLRGK